MDAVTTIHHPLDLHPLNLLANLDHQFTNRLSTCKVRLRLPHAFRREGVLLVDD